MRKTIIFDLDDTLIRHDRSDETKFLAEYLNICYSEDFSIAFYDAMESIRKPFVNVKIKLIEKFKIKLIEFYQFF